MPERAVDDLLFYVDWHFVSRWKAIAGDKRQQLLDQQQQQQQQQLPAAGAPAGGTAGAFGGCSLVPLEALVGVVEVAGSCLLLGLAEFSYLPSGLVDVLESMPMVAGRDAAAHKAKSHWVNKVGARRRGPG